MVKRVIFFSILHAIACLFSFPPSACAAGVESFEEKAIAETDEVLTDTDKVSISLDCRRIALPTRSGGVLVDGEKGETWDEIKLPAVFSADGRHYYYAARRGDKWHLIRDGVAGAGFSGIIAAKFSPVGERFGFAAEKSPGDCVFSLDGKNSESFKKILGFEFSPDGKRAAFLAEEEGRKFVVEDGKRGKPYDFVLMMTFSPDGKRLAYLAKRGEDRFLVLDGKEQEKHDKIGSEGLKFSPDSRHVAYIGVENSEMYFIIDGKRGPKFYNIYQGIVFSPDGKRHAYHGIRSNLRYLVVDGKTSSSGEDILVPSPVFSPDSKHVASFYRTGNRCFIELDCKIVSEEEAIATHFFTFSPDSQKYVYGIKRDKKWAMSISGKIGPFYNDIYAPVFNSGWDNIAYVARITDEFAVIHNGKQSELYGDVWCKRVMFTPDGKRTLYFAKKGMAWCLIVNGEEVGRYEYLLTRADVASFHLSNEVLRFFACKLRKIVAFEYRFK